MNQVEASPKQQILELVKRMTISEEQFSAFNKNIEKKRAEGPFQARTLEMQPELDRIFEVYKRAVEAHGANLKTQYDLGQKTIREIESMEDLPTIVHILVAFKERIASLLDEHKRLEVEIRDCESRIPALLPAATLLTR